MRTYRQLFGVPEFTPLFVSASLLGVGSTVSGIALASQVFSATHSPLLAALSMFGGSFAQAVGAVALLSAADRLPPRAAETGLAGLAAAGAAVLAFPGLPVPATFAVLFGLGLAGSVGGGVRYGLLAELLPKEAYVLGRSALNMSAGVTQIAGFAVGGVLVAALSPRGALLVAAALALAAAAVALGGLSSRPARAAGRPSVRETWRVNRLILSSAPRRYVYLALWVPNGLIVGCESVLVPYAPRHAGLLLAAAATGMLAGDVAVGRLVPPRRRPRLATPLLLLLAAPYLLFAVRPGLPLAVAAIMLASAGYAASLVLMERLVGLTPDDIQGQSLGLHTSGMLTLQGVGAALAGAVAQHTSAATAMAVMAAASVAVSLALIPGLRAGAPAPAAPGPPAP
ncbi:MULTISPECIES: MFS transporter [unclassified Streptomyces]|uniref:MFS transporter n=1 Tax=unclassified Streptomyces TaxID=2593676 RepID=UPI002E12A6D6|nr:MFS transporter [Streptomyces sp. NBC_01197]WSS52036.1 MFS transporter [Streptomyces sp. NBC_01180]